jgi:hypothetical protein
VEPPGLPFPRRTSYGIMRSGSILRTTPSVATVPIHPNRPARGRQGTSVNCSPPSPELLTALRSLAWDSLEFMTKTFLLELIGIVAFLYLRGRASPSHSESLLQKLLEKAFVIPPAFVLALVFSMAFSAHKVRQRYDECISVDSPGAPSRWDCQKRRNLLDPGIYYWLTQVGQADVALGCTLQNANESTDDLCKGVATWAKTFPSVERPCRYFLADGTCRGMKMDYAAEKTAFSEGLRTTCNDADAKLRLLLGEASLLANDCSSGFRQSLERAREFSHVNKLDDVFAKNLPRLERIARQKCSQ